ncbi:cell wall binding repeat-containing protein [Clostridium sp. DL-VIII]|uniref:N-acetylmuramoyl-L-alanine amidase family protein n=1 Tax=Clostridium sp. DL-VIII TaxID=641107 RepID=UPI00023B06C7|nr:N-acetylmuramoyl-L-alanine amidase family protein [Clostridium sp. DL-VIII]EHJ02097.1 cell wall binding repeat-containing protein [Clostridium sp. DL-VIII]
MIRKINKIMALILICTSIITTVSVTVINKAGNAAENLNSSIDDEGPTDEQIFYLIKSELDAEYAKQNCIVLADSTPVKYIPLIVTSDMADKISETICTDSFVKEQIKEEMISAAKASYNTNNLPPEVINEINNKVDNMTEDELGAYKETVKKAVASQILSLNGQSMPIYAYKAIDKTDMKTVKDQGYFAGGKVGYMYMEKQGKPLIVSAAELDNTAIGKIIEEVKDKLLSCYKDIKDLINEINGSVTDLIDSISNAVDDLTDSLKDKDDDIDDAWDKVFDRFDNDKGWGRHDGYRYYYDKDGVSLKGVQTIKGKTYYFNRIDGAMETGWQIVDGKRCYFDKNKGYEVYNQWVQDGDDWYFVGDDGSVKKMQWVNDGGNEYYLKADGKMTRDWLKIDDYWYHFNESGIMEVSAWKWSDGKWYYLRDNGQAAIGWIQLGSKYYYFGDPSGEMQTGWFRADGNWYCSNDDGAMKTGWAESKDGLCYLDDATGIMKKNEWVTIDGKTYYFNVNGIMVTGSRYIDGTKYVFNPDGTLSE